MDALRALRDGLLENRSNWEAACAAFAWPVLDEFNWALDWFDPFARGNTSVGLLVVEADGSSVSLTFDELATRSDRIAGWLREHLAPYKRIRRIEFYELPKTISGKIRRVELRTREQADSSGGWSEADFPELKR